MNISYDYYRVFYYVAKYKSFTAAAKVLMNNQPNLTRMIKKLEYELGCTLFIRQRHGISLTPEGQKLYSHVAVAFEHIQCGEEEVAREKSLQSGTVSVASSEIALHCVLLPALKTFRSSYPGIRLRISNLSTPQAIDVLKKGLADLAIVTEPFDLPSDLSCVVLQPIQEVPVCSTSFSLGIGTSLKAVLLKKYPVIGLEEQTGSFSFFSDFFNEIGFPFSPDISAATADQILPMVKSDLGIGFVPMEFLKKEDMADLVILQMDPPIPPRNICILKRRDMPLSIAAAELEKVIMQG